MDAINIYIFVDCKKNVHLHCWTYDSDSSFLNRIFTEKDKRKEHLQDSCWR